MIPNEKRVITGEMAIFLGLFLLAAINLLGNFYYYIFAALVVYVVMYKKIKIDSSIIWYILFTVVYGTYGISTGLMTFVRRCVHIVSYILGFNTMLLITKKEMDIDQKENWMKACCLTVAIGTWIHLMLNFFINRGSTGNRNTIDIWTGQVWSATGQASLAIFMIAVGISLFFAPQKKKECLFSLAALLMILLYNLTLGGRTIILLMGIIAIVGLVYIISAKQVPSYRKQETMGVILLLGTGIFLIYTLDIANIRTALLDSNLAARFSDVESTGEVLEDGRIEKKINYLLHMHEYPFGGTNLRERFGHAHDLFLDAYDECGFMILIAIIGMISSAFIDVIKTLKSNIISYNTKCLILCLYLAVLIEFCLEPILVGMPWFFACFALLSGCTRGLVSNYI